ncbi:MAG: DUF4157 domain-containing protein [Chloroflexota bacterium]|nr:MAG: DUF4157 domain-containing protein [Chloroflexota bacterium]
MSSEHTFEDKGKGKVKPKPVQETAEPQKEGGSLTTADMEGSLDASTLTQMQQTVGNAAVQRFLAQRQDAGPAEVQEEAADSINAKRGGGHSLDPKIAGKAGKAMGENFSDVNVHSDSQADDLSRQLGAKAFTTGNDIFFQSGAYDPGSSDGQRLIAHELTHVSQQSGNPPSGQGKLTVNDPNDQYEKEADAVADRIMNQPEEAIAQRQEMPEEEEEAAMAKPDLARQPIEEEEEELQPKRDPSLRRQEEEEMVMGMPDLARQPIEEEEEMLQARLDPSLQRQEMPEEEEEMAMAMPDLARQPIEEEEEELMPKRDPSLLRQEELPEEEI